MGVELGISHIGQLWKGLRCIAGGRCAGQPMRGVSLVSSLHETAHVERHTCAARWELLEYMVVVYVAIFTEHMLPLQASRSPLRTELLPQAFMHPSSSLSSSRTSHHLLNFHHPCPARCEALPSPAQ